jgi:hypothetical protein
MLALLRRHASVELEAATTLLARCGLGSEDETTNDRGRPRTRSADVKNGWQPEEGQDTRRRVRCACVPEARRRAFSGSGLVRAACCAADVAADLIPRVDFAADLTPRVDFAADLTRGVDFAADSMPRFTEAEPCLAFATGSS